MRKKTKAAAIVAVFIILFSVVTVFAAPSPAIPTPSAANVTSTGTPAPNTPKPTQSTETTTSQAVAPVPVKSTPPPSQTPNPTEPSPVVSAGSKDDVGKDLTDDAIKSNNKIPNKSNYAVDRVYDPSLLDFLTIDVDPAYFLVNILFQVQKTTVELVMAFVGYAFTLDPTTWLHDIVNKTISGVYRDTFSKISMIMLAVVGGYMIMQMARRNKNKVFSTIFKTVLILAAAEYFYLHPIQIMDTATDYINNISISFASNVFYDDTVPGDKKDNEDNNWPVTATANGIFNEYIHRPWQILEFGSAKTALKGNSSSKLNNEDTILSKVPGVKRTKDYTEIQEKEQFSTSSTKRLGFILVYFIPLGIDLAVIMIMCVLVLAYKFFLLLLIFLGIFIFPLSLIPGTGIRILKEWAIKIFGIACMQIVLVFLLGLMLQLNNAIIKSADTNGWLVTIFIQSIIYTFIFLKRKEIVRIFNKVQRGAANPARFTAAVRMGMREIGSNDLVRPVMRIPRKFKNAAGKTVSVPKKAVKGGTKTVYRLGKNGTLGKKAQIITAAAGTVGRESVSKENKVKALETMDSKLKKLNEEKAKVKAKKAQEKAARIAAVRKKARETVPESGNYSKILKERLEKTNGNGENKKQ
jgi:hypothetical protein